MTRSVSSWGKHIAEVWHASLEQQAQAGYLRTLQMRESSDQMHDFSSNDYLGLHSDPAVKAAAIDAIRVWGTGSTGSRLVSGDIHLIEDFEQSLAQFCGWESALVFSSGYLANLGIITALHKQGGIIFSDQGAHASLIDGCRLSKSQIKVFPRGNATVLRQLLEEYRTESPCQTSTIESFPLIITDAVYSIDGKLAPIMEYYAIAQEFQAILLVDEAHSIGVLGSQGQGIVHALGLSMAGGLIVTGTLSKSFGSQGGFILSERIVRDYCINFARQFIFDTALAPAAVGAAFQALDIMRGNVEMFSRIKSLHQLLQNELTAREIPYICNEKFDEKSVESPVGMSQYSPAIISLNISDPAQAKAAQLLCQRYGYAVGCFRPPSVPVGSSLLRITLKASHSVQDIVNLAEVLQLVYQELSLVEFGKGSNISVQEDIRA